MRFVWIGSLALVGCLGLTACKGSDDSDPILGLGADCSADTNGCRIGLACVAGTCQARGDTAEGNPCQLDGDCVDGLRCNHERVCATEGAGGEGDTCAGSHECQAGHVCLLQGLSATCQLGGDTDRGGECAGPTDCAAGLSCVNAALSSVCNSPPPALPGSEPPPPTTGFWGGVSCEQDTGPVRAYFELPTGTELDGDFYRLPFPNDVHRTDNGLDLSRHPAPGTALSVDAVGRYLRAAETDLDGFSLNPVVYFRFSRAYDRANTGSAVTLVNIDENSPGFGTTHPVAWINTSGPLSKYICPDWLGYRTLHGFPLRPGTTYAAFIEDTITPSVDIGGTFARSGDLDAMLSDVAPTEPRRLEAWNRYAPLRTYLGMSDTLEPARVLNATVFTTQREPDMAPFRDAIRASAAPTLSDVTLCADGVTSPCEDESGRGACGAVDPRVPRDSRPHCAADFPNGDRSLPHAR